jgi:protein ImuB
MSRARASLPLFEAESVPAKTGPAPPALPGPRVRRGELWLCLLFSRLPLEIRSAGEPDALPLAVVDAQGRVLMASGPAADAGVGPGLPLNAALALCPWLEVVDRDEAAEASALERLAAWSGRFSSLVSLVPPDALLMEIGRSLRFFGGLPALRRRLRRGLSVTGHEAVEGIAPTPLAALWLARAGDDLPVEEADSLPVRLGRLPPGVTGWSPRALETLRGLGVSRLEDCMRLPRDGFARRLGQEVLADLDRALGRAPDARAGFRAPDTYRGFAELAAETVDPGIVARAAARLFAELEGFLRSRQAAVSALRLRFDHLRRAPTRLGLELVRPDFRAARFSLLFAERLERLALSAPVIGVGLQARPCEMLRPEDAVLFGHSGEMDGEGLRLVERLRARLGRAAVHGLGLQDEHRPEIAWRVAEPGSPSEVDPPDGLSRPCWLLEPPRSLHCPAGRPRLEGELVPESGPERIESGWWDGQDVARDYWVMKDVTGVRVWVFRERDGRGRWFLHGIFG